MTIAHAVRLACGMLPPIHPAGRPFIVGAAVASFLLPRRARRLGLLLTTLIAWFFREPVRVTPVRAGIAVAPADGTVSQVVAAVPPAELGLPAGEWLRVSVFLSVFDVHVQRAPVTGEVLRVAYRPGAFLSADLDKASADNERNSLLLRTFDGHEVVVTQIA